MRRLIITTAGVLAMVWPLAACGEDSPDGGSAGTDTGTASVSVRDDPTFGEILVDSSGNALYSAEQEATGTVVCVADCAGIWPPLTLPDGETPTVGDGVTGSVGTVTRDDGTVQVTYNGAPLYTFSLDPEPGSVTGEGVADAFDGTDFVWHVATVSGEVPTAPATSEDDPGYRY